MDYVATKKNGKPNLKVEFRAMEKEELMEYF
jgi:hypothetical protein